MRCGYLVAGLLGLLLLTGCGTSAHLAGTDIELAASASADEWKAIKANVHEVHSSYQPWNVEAFGTAPQRIHTKMCAPGTRQLQLQLLTNKLKFKAFALGATGITQLEVHIVPWRRAPPEGSRCAYGYMEAAATALILDKSQFPYLYPEYQGGSVKKRPN